MDDDSRVIDKGWDALPEYASKTGEPDDDVTVSISTTPGEWLVNTVDAVVVPMSMAEVVDALRIHKLTERSLVWRAGMQEWAPVDKVPQLKLAARLPARVQSAPPPSTIVSVAPASPGPASVPRPSSAPGRPATKTPPPRPSSAPQPAPQALSRRSTLPFGLPVPNPASRPLPSRPSEPKLAAPPVARTGSEPDVLAVYDRPAATISFDLSPAESVRIAAPAPTPVAAAPPQTLAPTTSDTHSSPRNAPPPAAWNDLSVVAASQFRAVQRSSKRVLFISSLASAALASLLTLWLSRGGLPSVPTTLKATAVPVAALVPAPQPVSPPVAAAPVTPEPVKEPVEVPSTSPAAKVAPAPVAVAAPAKVPSRRARAVNTTPGRAAESPHGSLRDPSSEPNPYDVKLEDDPPSTASRPAPRPVTLDEGKEVEASAATGSSSPGF